MVTPKSEIRFVTLVGLGLNVALGLLKCVIGLIGNSQALVADGVHSFSDCVTDLAVIFGVAFWTAPADADHPHGHGRIETLISLIIGAVVAGVGVMLGYRAIAALHLQQKSAPEEIVFFAACLSILLKEILYRWNVKVGKRINSSALIANAWHHRSDALSSVPVAGAVLGIQIMPTWGFLDHVATVIVAILILKAGWDIMLPALNQLIDKGASIKDREIIYAIAKEVDQVLAVHAVRTRYIGTGMQIDLHIQVDPQLSVKDGHAVAGLVKARLLKEGPNVVDVLVHLEPYEDQ